MADLHEIALASLPGLFGIDSEQKELESVIKQVDETRRDTKKEEDELGTTSIKTIVESGVPLEEFIRSKIEAKKVKKQLALKKKNPTYYWRNKREKDFPTAELAALDYFDKVKEFYDEEGAQVWSGHYNRDPVLIDREAKLDSLFDMFQSAGNDPYIMYNEDIGSYRGSSSEKGRAYIIDDKRRYFDKNTGEYFTYGEYLDILEKDNFTSDDLQYMKDNIISIQDIEGGPESLVDTIFVTPPSLDNRGIDPYLAELAHAIQYYNKYKDEATDTFLAGPEGHNIDWRDLMRTKSIEETRELGRKDIYRTPGTFEYEAHKIIEPQLQEYFEDWIEGTLWQNLDDIQESLQDLPYGHRKYLGEF